MMVWQKSFSSISALVFFFFVSGGSLTNFFFKVVYKTKTISKKIFDFSNPVLSAVIICITCGVVDLRSSDALRLEIEYINAQQ